MKKQILLSLATIAVLSISACTTAEPMATDKDMMEPKESMEMSEPVEPKDGETPDPKTKKMFMVEIENVSSGDSATPLAPGVWVLHKDGTPIFAKGEKDMGKGLESLAEDGDPGPLAGAIGGKVFDTPMGDSEPGPATPGKKYTFEFEASPGDRLSFATMYVQSNDGFYATPGAGVPLFKGTDPLTGDYTNQVMLWDAGTEKNQEPTKGADQAPRQAGPNTGEAEDGMVMLMSDKNDGFEYPNAVKVTVSVK